MKCRRRVSVLWAVLAILATSCAHPSSITTPQGQVAYTADQIVQRINELQNAAIAANQTLNKDGSKGLPDATTRAIVTYCTTVALPTLKATPAGWQQTVVTGWTALKGQIRVDLSNPLIASVISSVDLVLAAYGG